jgi:transcriptional regulator with XRE-family HTH domain
MTIDTTRPATLSERVAEEIRVAMARRRIKQSQLARMIDQNDQWVSVRLNGRQEIGLNDLEVIAAALGMQAAQLLSTPPATGQKPPSRRRRHPDTTTTPSPTRNNGPSRPPSYPNSARRPAFGPAHVSGRSFG